MIYTNTRPARRATRVGRIAVAAVAGLGLAACGSGGGGATDTAGGGSGEAIGVSLITKTSTNPFFVAMQKGAQAEAAKDNVQLTLAAGKADGDEATQTTAIENAISQGQKGILITPNGPGVNTAIKKARDAGLFVIALDTPPDPPDTVDITFATDNFLAGKLIGQWSAQKFKGKKVTIAMLDLFNDKVVSVDVNRDQGFLEGMGINTADKTKNGDEAKTGNYSGGQYEIVCNQATQGAEDGGRTAMENCLSTNPNINLVYTINEPAAAGAYKALQAAGNKDAVIVSVDGGCSPGITSVKNGTLAATSQQYPVKMAQLGVKAIADYAKSGATPTTSSGLDFFNTGVQLVTDDPQPGVKSITASQAAKICWG